MKTSFQLSIDADLKQRLINLSNQTGISAARIISDMLRKYLPDEEKKYNIQLPLEERTSFLHPVGAVGRKDKRVK